MKLSKLEIRNIFGVREFTSDGRSLELTGRKGVGKSSIIGAVKLALTNKSDRPVIITDGTTEGEIFIQTDNGLRVRRKRRTEKADYDSIKQDPEKDEKTEAFLRQIFTPLQLDPVAFASMDAKEQNRIILDLIDFKWDMNWIREQFGEIPPDVDYAQNILCVLHDIQSEEGYYFKTRQELNREVRNKDAFIKEIADSLPPNYDANRWKNGNLSELYKKLEATRQQNAWIEKAKKAVKEHDNKIRSFQADLEIEKSAIERETSATRNSMEKQIAEMENRIKIMRKDLESLEDKKQSRLEIAQKNYEAKVGEFEGELKHYEDLAKQSPTDTSSLQEEAEHTERMKGFVNEYNRMVELQKNVEELAKKAEELTGKIEKARSLPGEILANANIPIAGLTIKDGIPLINGRPVSNLSDGEKLELCINVAVSREGSLRLLLLDGMEQLSTIDRERIYGMLKDKGVQFIASRTTDDDKLTVAEL